MIYFIEAVGIGHVKIGFTDADDAGARLETLQTGSPVLLRLLGTVPGSLADEKDLHRRFAAARVHGEWFKPVAELLALVPSVVPLVCGKVEVAEQSVSIRVLTVGRKQFTKALLYQLPQRCPLLFPRILSFFDAIKSAESPVPSWMNALSRFPISEMYAGAVWGWINTTDHTWVIHEFNGVLYRGSAEMNWRNDSWETYRKLTRLATGFLGICPPEPSKDMQYEAWQKAERDVKKYYEAANPVIAKLERLVGILSDRFFDHWTNCYGQLFIGV